MHSLLQVIDVITSATHRFIKAILFVGATGLLWLYNPVEILRALLRGWVNSLVTLLWNKVLRKPISSLVAMLIAFAMLLMLSIQRAFDSNAAAKNFPYVLIMLVVVCFMLSSDTKKTDIKRYLAL